MSRAPVTAPRPHSTDPSVRGRQRAVVAVAGRLTRLGARIGTRWRLLGFGQSAQLVLEVEGVVLFVDAELNRFVRCQRIRAIHVSLAALVEVIGELVGLLVSAETIQRLRIEGAEGEPLLHCRSPQTMTTDKLSLFDDSLGPSQSRPPLDRHVGMVRARQAKGPSRNAEVSARPRAPWPQEGFDVQKASVKTRTFRTEVSARLI